MTAPRYHETARLIDALAQWQGKPLNSIPPHAPPCGSIPGASIENADLANIFARLCAMTTITERVTYVTAAADRTRRHIRLAESTIRGVSNPRLVGAGASREAWATLRPMEAMADALEQWRDQLLDAWDAEVGVQFIDEAARTRIAS